MKKIIMSVIALAVITMTIGFVGCKKDKETINENQNENVERKPIAVVDKHTGKITYNITAELMQEKLSYSTYSKNASNIIVESFEIVSTDSKESKNEGVRFSIIDTDSEKSYTTQLNSKFLETKSNDDYVSYYFADDFEHGNFTYFNRAKNGTFKISVQNFEVTEVEEVPDSTLCYLPSAKVTVTCESNGCVSEGCKVYYDRYGNPEGCTDCGATGQNVYCKKIETSTSGNGDIIGILGIAATVLFGVLALI